MNGNDLYKLFFLIGSLFILAGIVFYLFRNNSLPFGKLPGDFSFEGKNFKFYFPLTSGIVLSILLSAILYLIRKWL